MTATVTGVVGSLRGIVSYKDGTSAGLGLVFENSGYGDNTNVATDTATSIADINALSGQPIQALFNKLPFLMPVTLPSVASGKVVNDFDVHLNMTITFSDGTVEPVSLTLTRTAAAPMIRTDSTSTANVVKVAAAVSPVAMQPLVAQVVIAPGTTSTSSVANTSVVVSQSAPSGGKAPYLYQFQRSTDGVKYANIGGASAQSTYTDMSLAKSQQYWYRCLVTDVAKTPIYSTPVIVAPR